MGDIAGGPPPEPRLDFPRAFKDAGIAALIALGLFLPLVGFQTVQNIRNELILETRPRLLLILVVIIALGRFIVSLARPRYAQRAPARPMKASASVKRWFAGVALGFVIAYPVIALALAGFGGAVKWIDNFGIQILIYVMLGWGLNIVVGLAGLLDLGYVAFYAVGAYSFALLAKNGLPFVAFVSEYPYLAVDFYQLGPW